MTNETQTNLNMFEQASRSKLRFESAKGMLYVEDLWDLPLQSTVGRPNLDDMAKSLFKKIKNSSDEVSFVTASARSNPTTQLMFDVVKHIIDVKMAENSAARAASDSKQREQYLLGLLAKKKGEKDESMSIEDIQKALAEIGA